jgi:hypothetical protein
MRIRLSASVPEELIEKIKVMAQAQDRNFSNMVSVLLKNGIESKTKKTA